MGGRTSTIDTATAQDRSAEIQQQAWLPIRADRGGWGVGDAPAVVVEESFVPEDLGVSTPPARWVSGNGSARRQPWISQNTLVVTVAGILPSSGRNADSRRARPVIATDGGHHRIGQDTTGAQ